MALVDLNEVQFLILSLSLLKILGNVTLGNLSKLFILGIWDLNCLTLEELRGVNISLNESGSWLLRNFEMKLDTLRWKISCNFKM